MNAPAAFDPHRCSASPTFSSRSGLIGRSMFRRASTASISTLVCRGRRTRETLERKRHRRVHGPIPWKVMRNACAGIVAVLGVTLALTAVGCGGDGDDQGGSAQG